MPDKHMTLEEVERRLRAEPLGVHYYDRQAMADAIRAHLRECVPAERVRECRDWMLRVSDMETNKGVNAQPAAMAFTECWRAVDALLPPEPDPLDQAIALVMERNAPPSTRPWRTWLDDMEALLRKAKEERHA